LENGHKNSSITIRLVAVYNTIAASKGRKDKDGIILGTEDIKWSILLFSLISDLLAIRLFSQERPKKDEQTPKKIDRQAELEERVALLEQQIIELNKKLNVK
jgi:hypothetical protein